MGDVRAVEPLIMALEDEAGSTHSAVAEALGQLGDIRAVEPIINAMKYRDQSDPVHSAAVAALEELAKKQPACLERIRVMQSKRGNRTGRKH